MTPGGDPLVCLPPEVKRYETFVCSAHLQQNSDQMGTVINYLPRSRRTLKKWFPLAYGLFFYILVANHEAERRLAMTHAANAKDNASGLKSLEETLAKLKQVTQETVANMNQTNANSEEQHM